MFFCIHGQVVRRFPSIFKILLNTLKGREIGSNPMGCTTTRIVMKKTHARRKFKKLLGQANHFLITSLIGLNYIKETENIKKPDEFSTSWEPHNPKVSALRSRVYILNSSLAWTVDCLDSYFIMIHRKPKMIISSTFTSLMSQSNRSVYKKAINIGNYFSIDLRMIAMIEILITWRNNLTHNFAENQIEKKSESILLDNKSFIKDTFSGLDIEQVLKKAIKGDSPSFKECASLISVTHKFVESIDKKVLEQLNIENYAKNIFCLYFQEDFEKRISKFFGKDIESRSKTIENILKNEGAFDTINPIIISNLLKLNNKDISVLIKESEEL